VSTADAGNGHLHTYAHCHDSSPKRVESWAGVGFWYVPNRSGLLTVSTAPNIRENLWTGASWNDVGQAGGWVSLGIASYLRQPFRLDRWETIKTDQLWWNEDNWFDFTTHNQDIGAYSMSVQSIGDTAHYYACWAWIHSYAYAENGGSYGGADLTVDVRGFTYSFL
jgi:hypothetical protein